MILDGDTPSILEPGPSTLRAEQKIKFYEVQAYNGILRATNRYRCYSTLASRFQ